MVMLTIDPKNEAKFRSEEMRVPLANTHAREEETEGFLGVISSED